LVTTELFHNEIINSGQAQYSAPEYPPGDLEGAMICGRRVSREEIGAEIRRLLRALEPLFAPAVSLEASRIMEGLELLLRLYLDQNARPPVT
jgi:hypothetical protein